MYQSGFRPVLSAMVDPEIRVIVTAEFGRIDESHRCIAVAFDPLLERDRMTMPAPEYLASLYEHDNRTPPPVIFRSEQKKELAKFFVKNRCAVDRLELHLEEGDKPLSFYGYTETVSEAGFLYAVLSAALELPLWDELANGCKVSEVAMFVGSHTANRLRSEGCIFEGQLTAPYALFRKRPVLSRKF